MARKNKKAEKKGNERWAITFLLSAIVFSTLLITTFIIYIIIQSFFTLDIFTPYNKTKFSTSAIITLTIIITVLINYIISLIVSKALTQFINKLVNAMDELASGNYKYRLKFKKPFSKTPTYQAITQTFNKLANELEHTETLNYDFINNFSHEFKTPIVSIAGFAKLLQKGNLSSEQQEEYLKIIEEESNRLSQLAVGVMDMMKIENQCILTDVTTYNLSEQIRNCLLLLEQKWSKKNLNLEIDFDEHEIHGNEELLKHVWINLLDNAVKFTPENGTIKIDITPKDKNIEVSILNTGSEISPEGQNHIFNKFYQEDVSHSSQGYGIGLAVVKQVTKLHNGQVSVFSGNNQTKFLVSLPR